MYSKLNSVFLSHFIRQKSNTNLCFLTWYYQLLSVWVNCQVILKFYFFLITSFLFSITNIHEHWIQIYKMYALGNTFFWFGYYLLFLSYRTERKNCLDGVKSKTSVLFLSWKASFKKLWTEFLWLEFINRR